MARIHRIQKSMYRFLRQESGLQAGHVIAVLAVTALAAVALVGANQQCREAARWLADHFSVAGGWN